MTTDRTLLADVFYDFTRALAQTVILGWVAIVFLLEEFFGIHHDTSIYVTVSIIMFIPGLFGIE